MIPDLAIQSCSYSSCLFSVRGSVDLWYPDAMHHLKPCLIGASVPAIPVHIQLQDHSTTRLTAASRVFNLTSITFTPKFSHERCVNPCHHLLFASVHLELFAKPSNPAKT